jgi:hypothetical protein
MVFSAGNAAPSPRDVLHSYHDTFRAQVAAGELKPLIYPYHFFSLHLLLAYLTISHTNRPWIYALRWPVFAVIVAFEVKTLRETSSTSMAIAFAAGLVAAWGIVWSATMLIFNDPERDFKRVEEKKQSTGHNEDKDDGSTTRTNGHADGLRQRKQDNRNPSTDGVEIQAVKPDVAGAEYYWQSYPDSLGERLDWVCDTILNFRGPGWSWAIPTLPSLSPSIKVRLGEAVELKDLQDVSSAGIRRFETRRQVFLDRFPKFVVGYFVLDLLKVVMMKDPYFYLGPNGYDVPSHMAHLSPAILSAVRQLISFTAIIVSLEMTFTLPPLILCCLLGPRILGLRGAAFQYPTTWSRSLTPILAKGLGGLWGSWWHQTFRFAFSSPTKYIQRIFSLPSSSPVIKFIGPFIAFAISGFLHAGGSLTQPAPTKPWDPPLFFMLQVPGILLQTTLSSYFKDYISRLPDATRRAGNFAFTFTWLYYTAPILVDDFARGGIWLYEPIPISPLRGLGFGREGDGWLCWEWDTIGVGWHTGKHWWETGLAL